MVELAVEVLELLEGQFGNHGGIAARVHSVGVVGEERLLRLPREHRVRGGVHALHLVVHDTLVRHLLVRGVQLVVPALLLERLLVVHAARVEDGVEVDVHEVPEVLEVARGDGVAGAVGVGHGVEEGVQRALDELDEGFLDGVLAGPAQHGVFQDVGDAGGVGGGRAEGDAEALVLVVVAQAHDLGAGLGVLEEEHLGVVLGDVVLADELEAVQVRRGLELGGVDGGLDRLAVHRANRADAAWAEAAGGTDRRCGPDRGPDTARRGSRRRGGERAGRRHHRGFRSHLARCDWVNAGASAQRGDVLNEPASERRGDDGDLEALERDATNRSCPMYSLYVRRAWCRDVCRLDE